MVIRAAVLVRGVEYVPARVEVARGGRVTWIDRDRSNHTVTLAHPDQPGVDNVRPGQRKTVQFKVPGTFSYVCDHHPDVKAMVEVE